MHVWLSQLGLAVVIGTALGLWFFGGLLWTVHRLPYVHFPGLLAIASFLVRTAGVVAGMIWLVRQHWLLPMIALVAFLVVRSVVLRIWGFQESQVNPSRLP